MNKLSFYGYAGAGKDYLVSHLVENYGYKRLSFSDQLKKVASSIFDWLEEDYKPISKETPLCVTTSLGETITHTPREIWLMVNKLREVEDNLFVRMFVEEYSRCKTDKIVVSDVRTDSEYQLCKSLGFSVIKVEPSKMIYEPNEFDKQQDKFVPDFIFPNNFNGLSEFEEFMKQFKLERVDFQNPYRNVPEE